MAIHDVACYKQRLAYNTLTKFPYWRLTRNIAEKSKQQVYSIRETDIGSLRQAQIDEPCLAKKPRRIQGDESAISTNCVYQLSNANWVQT